MTLAYSAKDRNPAVDPKTIFKILTYAYPRGIYSSRKIERACRRDIYFMWLLAGQKTPDHSTIARFRTGFLASACEDLFYQLVRLLSSMGELSKETVFIDGTKLEACANKYTADLQMIVDFMEQYCQDHPVFFVHGRGKRKTLHQKYEETEDYYICHAGKHLHPLYVKKQRSKNGYQSDVTVYECENCTGCLYKEKCIRSKGNKRLYVSKKFIARRQESYENILSDTGILYRMNRSIQVERAFGVLKNDYEFQRFLLRGKTSLTERISYSATLPFLYASLPMNKSSFSSVFCNTLSEIQKTAPPQHQNAV